MSYLPVLILCHGAPVTRTNVKPYKYAWTDWFQAISTQSNLCTTFQMKHIIYIEIIYYIYAVPFLFRCKFSLDKIQFSTSAFLWIYNLQFSGSRLVIDRIEWLRGTALQANKYIYTYLYVHRRVTKIWGACGFGIFMSMRASIVVNLVAFSSRLNVYIKFSAKMIIELIHNLDKYWAIRRRMNSIASVLTYASNRLLCATFNLRNVFIDSSSYGKVWWQRCKLNLVRSSRK